MRRLETSARSHPPATTNSRSAEARQAHPERAIPATCRAARQKVSQLDWIAVRLASPLLAAGIEGLVTEHERVGVLLTGGLGEGGEKRMVEVSREVTVRRIEPLHRRGRLPFTPEQQLAPMQLAASVERGPRRAQELPSVRSPVP